jgi:hypothetical protein
MNYYGVAPQFIIQKAFFDILVYTILIESSYLCSL